MNEKNVKRMMCYELTEAKLISAGVAPRVYDSVPRLDDSNPRFFYQSASDYVDVEPSEPSNTSTRDSKPILPNVKKRKSACCTTKTAVTVLSIIEAIIILALLCVFATFTILYRPRPPLLGSYDRPARSCLHLRNSGTRQEGIYFIQTQSSSAIFKVYCDMTTQNGGWTLVASISNPTDNCSIPSLWYANTSSQAQPTLNWRNEFVFGSINQVTVHDYKNPGYYKLQASNVLFRHVDRNEDIASTRFSPLMEYYSTNDLLEIHGGNLYSISKDVREKYCRFPERILNFPVRFTRTNSNTTQPLSGLLTISTSSESKQNNGPLFSGCSCIITQGLCIDEKLKQGIPPCPAGRSLPPWNKSKAVILIFYR